MNQQVIIPEGKRATDRRVQKQVASRKGHKVKVKDRRVLSSRIGFVGWLLMTALAWFWALDRGGQAAWFVASALGFLLLYAVIVGLTAFGKPRAIRQISQEHIVAGDTLRVVLELDRVSRWYPLMWVRIRDELRDVNGRVVSVHQELVYLGMRGRASCAYEYRNVPRGIYEFGTVTIEAGEPLGLVSRRWRTGGGRDRLTVIPAPLRGLAPDGMRRLGWDGAAVIAAIADASAATPLVSTVREYTHGDPLQRIHWKSTARTGGLKTKELDALDNRHVVVVLDDAAEAYGSGRAARSRFETAASTACAVVEAAKQHGLAVRLRSSGGGAGGRGGGSGSGGHAAGHAADTPPTEAPAHAARRALAQLAAAEPRGRIALADALREQLAGATPDAPLVLVTPRLDAPLCDCVAMLRARRYAVSLILINDTERLDERTQQLRRQLAAVHCAVTVAVTRSASIGVDGRRPTDSAMRAQLSQQSTGPYHSTQHAATTIQSYSAREGGGGYVGTSYSNTRDTRYPD